AAGLVLDEPLVLAAEVHDAGALVQEDEATAAQADGALLANRLRLDDGVEDEVGGDAQQRSAGLQRFEVVTFRRAATADLVGVADFSAEGELEGADALHVARYREDHRTGVALGPDLGVLFDAVAHDPGGAVVAADVVDVAALAEDAGRCREGRADLRH